MADESNAPAIADAPKPVELPERAAEPVAEPAVAEAKPAEGGPVAIEAVAEGMCQSAQECTREPHLTIN